MGQSTATWRPLIATRNAARSATSVFPNLKLVEIRHHVVDGLSLIARLFEREGRLELGVSASCSFDWISVRRSALRIELEQLFSHLLDSLLNASLLRREGRATEAVEPWLVSFTTFEFLNHPESRCGYEELVAACVFDDHHLHGLRRAPMEPIHRG